MARIFISYRRSNTDAGAGRIYDFLGAGSERGDTLDRADRLSDYPHAIVLNQPLSS